MAKFQITAPDGQKFVITAPEGATAEQAYAAFQKAQGEAVAAEPQPGSREYADLAAERARAGETLPMVSEAPPEWQQPQREANLMDGVARLGETASDTFTGAMQGLTMGSYDELASAVGTPINAVGRLVTGEDSINGMGDVLPFLGRSFQDTRQGQQEVVDQAYERSPVAAILGDLTGSAGLGLVSGGANITSIARPTLAGMAGRGAIEGGLTGSAGGFNAAPEDTLASRAASTATGGAAGAVLGAVTGGILGGRMAGNQSRAVPSVDDLKADAGMIYEVGRNSGLSASPQMSQDLADSMESIARKENVILPNGKTNPAYAALNGILDITDAYKGRSVSVGELQKIRDNIRDVVASPEPGVQRIALNMLDEFNDYAYKVYPELAEADDLYWKAKTGELVEKMGQLAQARSGQYSQSGMENALRAEFRAIERQIIKGKVKGLPPELVDQIKKVAQGDELQDFARWVSKFGIQNPLTSSTGILAGLASGSAIPTLGIWAGAQGAGALARSMANEKYKIASALARSGGQLPAQDYTPVAQALIQGGANVGGRGVASLTNGL